MEKLSKHEIFNIQDIINHQKLVNTENGLNFMVEYLNGDHSNSSITIGTTYVYENNSLIIYKGSDEIISMLYEDIEKLCSQIVYYQTNYKDQITSLPDIVITNVGKKYSVMSNLDMKAHYLVLVNEDTKVNLIYTFSPINTFMVECRYLPEKDFAFSDIVQN